MRTKANDLLSHESQSGGGALAPPVSLATLMSDNLPFVAHSLRRFGVPASEVDDAAQRVMLIAGARLTSIMPGSERAFLTGIALRVASHVRRARRRRDAAHRRFGDYLAVVSSAWSCSDRTEMRELLGRALHGMPSDLRQVFVLLELQQLTTAEAAKCLGLPRSTLATRLKRARLLFHEVTRSLELPLGTKTV